MEILFFALKWNLTSTGSFLSPSQEGTESHDIKAPSHPCQSGGQKRVLTGKPSGVYLTSSLLSGKHSIVSEWTEPLKVLVTGSVASLLFEITATELSKSMSFRSTCPRKPVSAARC